MDASANQSLNVVLKHQEPVPPTPPPTPTPEPVVLVPNTGTHTSTVVTSPIGTGEMDNSGISTALGGASVVFAIALIISFIIYYAKKHQLAKLLAKLFSITFITTFVLAAIFQLDTNVNNTNPTNPANPNATNSISLTIENFNLAVETTKSDTFAYDTSAIKVNEPTNHGYILSAYTTTPDLINATDASQKISGLSTASTVPTILTTNTWGFSLNQPVDQHSHV